MKNRILIILALTAIQASANQDCTYEDLQAESQKMAASTYWTQQFESLANELNWIRPRGCGSMSNEPTVGLEMFMDDLEFTGPHGAERVLDYSGAFGTELKAEQNQFFFYRANNQFYQPGVIEIYLSLKQGHLSLVAKTCSPKVALANLIAYAPYALTAGCGTTAQSGPGIGKIIQKKVNEILDGE